MGPYTTKQQLRDEIVRERAKLDDLLARIPPEDELLEVTDGMSVKDLLAHRAGWGRMLTARYLEARAGGTPAVPSERWGWNHLPELDAEIRRRYADRPLEDVERDFREVHDSLPALLDGMSDDEPFERRHLSFTGSSDLAAYVNPATAAHYRSARTHIARWWRERSVPVGQG